MRIHILKGGMTKFKSLIFGATLGAFLLLPLWVWAADWNHYQLGDFYPIETVTDTGLQEASQAVLRFSGATGFIISGDGYFLTNHHVGCSNNYCAPQQTVWISYTQNGAAGRIQGRLVLVDETLDLALYKANAQNLPYIPLKNSTQEPQVGTKVAVIGHPRSSPLQVSFGTILANNIALYNRYSVEYSAQTWWGNSGSPVVNQNGEVVALHWGWDQNGYLHGRLMGIPVAKMIQRIPKIAEIARLWERGSGRSPAQPTYTPATPALPQPQANHPEIILGEETSGQLAHGQTKHFTLRLSQGAEATVRLIGQYGKDFDLKITKPGTQFSRKSESSSSLETLTLSSSSASDYLISVVSYQGEGQFLLRVDADNQVPVINGRRVQGQLTTQNRAQVWLVMVQPGKVTQVNLSGPSGTDFDLYARLGAIPQSGAIDAASTSYGSVEQITLRRPGFYYLLVHNYRGTGRYSLQE